MSSERLGDVMETKPSISNSTVEFYLPGTFQFAGSPGRIERFLTRHLRSHDADVPAVGSARTTAFYLPATPGVRAR